MLKRVLGRRQFWAALWILALAVTIAVAIVQAEPPKNTPVVSGKPVKALTNCRDLSSADNFRCYATYYAAKTYSEGQKVAFADLKAAYENDGYIKSECHQLTHIIGRTGYVQHGGLDKAYEHGDSFCWSGYYHGAIEKAITDLGAERIKSDAPEVCQSFAKKRPYSFDHFNCVHGLGHGLMAVDDYNLPNALEQCDVLETGWDRSSCQGGVFMENVMVATRGGGTGAYFKDDQPLYPCTFVKQPYKEQCYLMQTSQILQKNGYDFTKTFALCAQADAGFADTCYRSLGRDASGSTISDRDRTVAICRLASDHAALTGCMLGAVRDFVSYHHSDKQALELCDAFGGDIVAPCKQDVKQYYKAF